MVNSVSYPITTCVILAAGRGSRLTLSHVITKSGFSFEGRTLIERQIHLFQSIGVRHFVIVVGYESDDVIKECQKVQLEEETILDFQYNDQWHLGNGYSVLAAKSSVKGPFYLVMADHIFEPTLLDYFKAHCMTSKSVTLAVDTPGDHNVHIDIEDVTKVKLDGPLISHIGKQLTDYDVYDTGLFRCSLSVFDALTESCQKGNDSLSGGIDVLAQKQDVDTVLISPHRWCDVDTPTDAHNAIRVMASPSIS